MPEEKINETELQEPSPIDKCPACSSPIPMIDRTFKFLYKGENIEGCYDCYILTLKNKKNG